MMFSLSWILNNAFYFSLLIIIISSLVGIFVRMRSCDRCLRDFDNFKVTLETRSGKLIWGVMNVYGSGFELAYQSEHHDLEGHVENSFILYNGEFEKIKTIYRYHRELSEANKQRRKKDIRRTYRPNIWYIFKRKIRNFFNTFRDALSQTFSLFIGTVISSQPKSVISQKQKDISGLGTTVITSASNAYDPIIERYIGQYVVVEIQQDETLEEKYGILKEYTEKFFELLNVRLSDSLEIKLENSLGEVTHDPLRIQRDGPLITVTNTGPEPAYVKKIFSEKFERVLDILIDSGKIARLTLNDTEKDSLHIACRFDIVRQVDLIVPRSIAVARHGGRIYKHSFETLLGINKTDSLEHHKHLS